MKSKIVRVQFRWAVLTLLVALGNGSATTSLGDESPGASTGIVHSFQRQNLTRVYYSEGTAAGDIDGDGITDVVYGPHWYAGPDFKISHEIYPPQPQPMEGYADHFFAWIHDFNNDGHNDVLVVGFPGTAAYVYENPGSFDPPSAGTSQHWNKHEILDGVANESPAFTDLTGDGQPELVCTRQGLFGFATPVAGSFETWEFKPISGASAPDQFGHGLGTGDIDGDGKLDLLTKDGWFQQPPSLRDQLWNFHAFEFAGPGGAEMHAFDINGDGLNDVVTSLEAHGYGLAWWEQIRTADGDVSFQQHLIVGSRPSENPYGVYFSEPHSVQVADIDGDGLLDIVTGKTYWSHHRQSPRWDAGAVVYWFKLTRTVAGVEWIPHLADDSSGIGRQIVIADVTGDKLPEIVTGGMLGCHVLRHMAVKQTGIAYAAAQPKPRRPLVEDLSGIAAADYMTVPQGFHVQLAAAEPDVHQPVAMAFDHRGRLWIAEAYTYPVRAPDGDGLDKIIILADTNHDGQFDKRQVFAEGLNLVSGLEVGMGGVWVGAAPYLMFIPDADGDDRPDGPPQILLDGFGYEDTHEVLNGFNWGPDGWLYGCHGVFTHSRIGRPGTADQERTPMNAAVWRYHPTRHVFEVFASGTSNPWGVDFDDRGQAFATACVIPHLFHIIQGGRYQRQAGQHFGDSIFDDIKTIADHSHFAGSINDHAWWGHEPDIKDDTSDAGGGHAHCGALIYLGDNWPDRYRNQIFFHNIHGNRVNMDRLVRSGSGYVGRHGDDLLLANDRWFRGINLRTSPDGSVYLIDWYDRNACHRTNPEIWDRTNGRVYNVAYGVPDRKSVDLAQLSDVELARLALHRNDWYVRMSRQLLQYRASLGKLDAPAVRAEIAKLLQHADETRVLRGVWVGQATGLLGSEQLIPLLSHASDYVAAWAVQFLCESDSVSGSIAGELERLATEKQSDPILRLYIAAALQRLPLEQRWEIAEALVQHGEDVSDHNLPLMIWYGLEPLVAQDSARALRVAGLSQIPLIRQYIFRRAAADRPALEILLAAMPSWAIEQQRESLREVLQAFEGQVNVALPDSWVTTYEKLNALDDDTELNDLVDRLAVVFGDQRVFPQLRAALADAERPLGERQRALEILLQGRDQELASTLFAALATPELQSAAIRALAAYSDERTPSALLAGYSQFSTTVREDAIATLSSRVGYADKLLDAIESGAVPRTDVHAFHVRQLAALADENLLRRVAKTWGRVGVSSAEQLAVIQSLKQELSPQKLESADARHGRLLYQKHCAACHTLFGAGEKIGPDLTGSNRANLDYLLENLIAPNAVVGKDYQMTLLQLIDGRVVSGLITQETGSAVTLKTINDLVVIAKADIEDRKLSEVSLMPTGLLETLTLEETSDLVTYLASSTQVSARGPRAMIDKATGKVLDGLEGESLKIVEKSAGNATSQSMREFTGDRWSGNDHLWWQGGTVGDRLGVEVVVPADGEYELQVVLTQARDYGIAQLYWDADKLGEPIDLFSPDVITTGVLTLGTRPMTAGPHRLTIEIVGANSQAVKSYMVGLDFMVLKPHLNNE